MRRRTFLRIAAVAGGAVSLRGRVGGDTPVVQTVAGPVPAADLGLTLAHEHVLVDFIGAGEVSPSRYRREDVVARARPHLERARERGVRTLVECTPAFLARDVRLLRDLGELTGLRFLTNTGLYGARQNRFLPPYAFNETARQLAGRWVGEAVDGIDGTDVRPGFIKCGVDADPSLSPVHRKLVEAAALAHLETGLTIAVHTGRGPGREQVEVLRRAGVHASAWIWVHAHGADEAELLAVAREGAWLSFDGLNPASLSRHLHLCTRLRDEGRLDQVLVSHDAGWYDPGKPDGGEFRGYDLLFSAFIPQLRTAGWGEDEVNRLLAGNPARAFARRVRRAQA